MPRGDGRPPARDLGTVVAVTPTGLLTVRSHGTEFPAEGAVVQDVRGAMRGRVVRVFGPVARPYWSVRPRRPPTPAEGVALIGTTVVRE